MKFQVQMMFLGAVVQESKKTQKSYMLGKFMNTENQSIFEFYIAGDRLALIQKLTSLKPFVPCAVTCELTSFNNKPDVTIMDVEQ